MLRYKTTTWDNIAHTKQHLLFVRFFSPANYQANLLYVCLFVFVAVRPNFHMKMCCHIIECDTRYMSCNHVSGVTGSYNMPCNSPHCSNSNIHPSPCHRGMDARCRDCRGRNAACAYHHSCRTLETTYHARRIINGYCGPNCSRL